MSDILRRLWYATLYRPTMRLAHRFHWHYAPPIHPDGDTVLWCKWCGMRDTVKRRADGCAITLGNAQHMRLMLAIELEKIANHK